MGTTPLPGGGASELGTLYGADKQPRAGREGKCAHRSARKPRIRHRRHLLPRRGKKPLPRRRDMHRAGSRRDLPRLTKRDEKRRVEPRFPHCLFKVSHFASVFRRKRAIGNRSRRTAFYRRLNELALGTEQNVSDDKIDFGAPGAVVARDHAISVGPVPPL